MDKNLKIIGRKDRIDLPELDIKNIEAKVDTGAYGCALHSHHVEILHIDGKDVLLFQVLDPDHPEFEGKTFQVEEFSSKNVKNSGGQKQLRFTFKTLLRLFDTDYEVLFSLTDRKDMKFPVLLGRKFLKDNFLVDVRQKDLSYRKKTKKS